MNSTDGQALPADQIARAFGALVKARRLELHRTASELGTAIGLSASYYRSLEAGSIAPPPSISVPLALHHGWSASRLSELLCVVSYLRGQDPGPNKTKAQRANKAQAAVELLKSVGLIPEVLATVGREGLEAVLSDFLSRGSPRPHQNPEYSASLPWMLGLTVRRLVADFAKIPFAAGMPYMLDFEARNAANISECVALLSYPPVSSVWESSGFSFAFLSNRFKPRFRIFYVAENNISDNDVADAYRAIELKRDKGVRADLRPKLYQELRAQVEMRRVTEKFAFSLNRETNRLLSEGAPGPLGADRFCNAWLFKLMPENAWVGFLDNFTPMIAPSDVVAAPLSLEDAENLAAYPS